MLKQLLYRWILPKLIANSCESRIPRSGKSGEKVNCYVVALDREETPFFIATGYENQTLTGLLWDGHTYANSHRLSLIELETGTLRITHYYGLDEITYDDIYSVVWHYITKIVYLGIHLRRHISSTHQYLFNKQKLVTKRRMELLKFMMDDQLERTHDGISLINLMTKLYSINWVLHPSKEQQQKKLKLYLDSLVDSGELQLINNQYVVKGKAISTYEKYEEEDRKHTAAVKLQKGMLGLTVILAIATVAQSGLIKLPTLYDFSTKDLVKVNADKSIRTVTCASLIEP